MFILVRRRTIGIFFSSIFFVGLSFGVYNFALHPNMHNWIKEKVLISEVNTKEKAVALTFDDGPDPTNTPAILDALKKHGARATFFVMGKRAEKYPSLLKRIIHEGHEIGNHSYSHADFNHKNSDFILNEIKKTNEVIYRICRQKPIYFRPPGGYLSYELVDLCKQEKLTIAYWTYQQDSKDWQDGVKASQIAAHIIKHIEPGQIIILHDGCPNGLETAKAVDILISQLTEDGYKFLTMSELLKLEKQE